MATRLDTAEEFAERDSTAADLLAKAAQCRRLAAGVCDVQASEVLRAMADNYEEGARLKA